MQMANRLALLQLREFLSWPQPRSASQIIGIPALHAVLMLYKNGVYPPELLELCEAIYQRGCRVFKLLVKHGSDEPQVLPQEDWGKVGTSACHILLGTDARDRLGRIIRCARYARDQHTLSSPMTSAKSPLRVVAPSAQSFTLSTVKESLRAASWRFGALMSSHMGFT